MKKSELVAEMQKINASLPEDKLTQAVDSVFDEISASLTRGDRVEIRGFGAFFAKLKPARTGRNPRTGEAVQIAAKNVIHFKYGKDLKEAVN